MSKAPTDPIFETLMKQFDEACLDLVLGSDGDKELAKLGLKAGFARAALIDHVNAQYRDLQSLRSSLGLPTTLIDPEDL